MLLDGVGLLGGTTFNGDTAECAVNVRTPARVWNVFASSPKTSFEIFAATEPLAYQFRYGSLWLGIDGGVTARLSKNSTFFANTGYYYRFGLSRQAFTGRVDLQAQW